MLATAKHLSSAGEQTLDYIDGLYGYAMVLTRNRAEAEDLVQETYSRALGAVSRLREGSNIQGWLFTILRNLWFNELRKRRASPVVNEEYTCPVGLEAQPDSRLNAHEIFVSNERAEAVHTAINSLPTEFRDIILLREFQELSYQEISEVLGCPAGTVMSRLGRARGRLRALLAGTWDGSSGRRL